MEVNCAGGRNSRGEYIRGGNVEGKMSYTHVRRPATGPFEPKSNAGHGLMSHRPIVSVAFPTVAVV